MKTDGDDGDLVPVIDEAVSGCGSLMGRAGRHPSAANMRISVVDCYCGDSVRRRD